MGGALACLAIPCTLGSAAASCFSCCCTKSMGADGIKPYMAKVMYVMLLGMGTLIGFGISRIAANGDPESGKVEVIPLFNFEFECDDDECNGDPAIFKASLASVFFFTFMMAGTFPLPTTKGEDRWRPLLGEGFHRGFWGAKIILYLVVLIAVMFWDFNFDAFVGVARFVAMLFLIMQILVLIEFAYAWNETWIERSDVDNDFADGSKCWLISLIGLSAGLYICALGGAIAIFILYNGCTPIMAITSVNLLLGIVGIVLMVFKDKIWDDEEAGGSLAPPAVVCFYLIYLAFSAAQSNPNRGDACDPFDRDGEQSPGDILLGIIIATFSLMWVSVSISGNPASLLGGGGGDGVALEDVGGAYEVGDGEYAGDNKDADDDTPSSGNDKLWFFHFVMISASFYMSMVLTNFGVDKLEVNQDAQVGNISMYVKATAGWVAGLLFIWSIVAPNVLDRDF